MPAVQHTQEKNRKAQVEEKQIATVQQLRPPPTPPPGIPMPPSLWETVFEGQGELCIVERLPPAARVPLRVRLGQSHWAAATFSTLPRAPPAPLFLRWEEGLRFARHCGCKLYLPYRKRRLPIGLNPATAEGKYYKDCFFVVEQGEVEETEQQKKVQGKDQGLMAAWAGDKSDAFGMVGQHQANKGALKTVGVNKPKWVWKQVYRGRRDIFTAWGLKIGGTYSWRSCVENMDQKKSPWSMPMTAEIPLSTTAPAPPDGIPPPPSPSKPKPKKGMEIENENNSDMRPPVKNKAQGVRRRVSSDANDESSSRTQLIHAFAKFIADLQDRELVPQQLPDNYPSK